ncbi:MarR family transcriptional regulator [Salmonella enterica]|uniref:MarR family transcriptional regulator n=1 Tax=Salmonella enterica subsp. enterica serovar Panama TaxID=29472 RepID=A0A5U8JG00_SALET|nr:MarR family transcriptional regulator [Salmonella enterica]EAA8760210.1 MarR family transcriptional regulator [Salmonella enterica subsp. enterica serovar Rubislaw]EBR7996953.1 MarR family transcriptional regulator [Salmonella enterica subsp. enterica serovar Panama]EBU7356013.1 MarR family transcriptional regulator [Salmonella enterica subsp. enterica serovar Poona]ASD89700.1 MarR family transcriptional regulator [Salmonella enterica subsp. enterica serovar India str. SA20085604]EAO9158107
MKDITDNDFVDNLIQEWLDTFPSLNLSGLPVIARIVRMSHYISQFVDSNLARYNLNVGEFEVLAALARNPDRQLSPKELQKKILISSGGLSNRINRLEEKKYIVRIPDPSDRRGVIVRITPEGRKLTLEAVVTHVAIEEALIQGLDIEDREQLARLLKKLIKSQKSELNQNNE